jgi:hypothetical protein
MCAVHTLPCLFHAPSHLLVFNIVLFAVSYRGKSCTIHSDHKQRNLRWRMDATRWETFGKTNTVHALIYYVLCADFLFLLQEWAKQYTSSLEAKGRYTLIIWPEHCIVSERHVWCLSLDSVLFVIWCVFQIGTNGHNVFPALNDSLQKWSQVTFGRLRYHKIDSL